MIKPRHRTCKIKAEGCHGRYRPFNSLQQCCPNPRCAIEAGKSAVAKRARRELKAYREKSKSRGEWLKEAQAAFNRFIRARDYDKPCISCGVTGTTKEALTGGYWDCGHYRSVGACPELRFEELNAHRQCKRCNSQLSGNVVEYRIRLIVRIGAAKVAWLEEEHPAKKYSIEDLKQIKKHYSKLANELEKARAA